MDLQTYWMVSVEWLVRFTTKLPWEVVFAQLRPVDLVNNQTHFLRPVGNVDNSSIWPRLAPFLVWGTTTVAYSCLISDLPLIQSSHYTELITTVSSGRIVDTHSALANIQ